MVIDTSAIIAILWDEPDAERFATAIEREPDCRISAATYVELGIVIDAATTPRSTQAVDLFLESGKIGIKPLTPAQARIARLAHQQFGRGSGHPAKLNLGDCFSYALAAELGQALLFKGEDFSRTDIRPAL